MPRLSSEEYQRNRELQLERASIGNKVRRFLTHRHFILGLIWCVGLVSFGVVLSLWASKEEIISLVLSLIVSIGVLVSVIQEKSREIDRLKEYISSFREELVGTSREDEKE
jgi:cobalamin biosynthesis protein CobD/CbiB